ncbi:HEAT repeat-containing protein 1 [Phytophthora boehmeriae]|uniref:HEAT repeat-containing protein 1 n=1 Tax=Phytophthora boehmeriae TaxID=109152 RepID=A0A8T1X765_9STRA|nr:HEAT repeat-containing protein 1 [Phytophthora boehmeriae]
MASALATQLQQLREAGAGSKRRTDTFLYDQQEAVRLDDETIYNLAWNGLLELKQLDARFEDLDADSGVQALFSRQRIHFHRSQTTKQDEPELNAALGRILDALSAYFLLGAAHKVLEFLVRRYEVHRYNVDAVMGMMVAYHESSWFVRMVRILHIRNTRWEFLLVTKTQGVPLRRAALVQRCVDESSVIEFLFTAATRIGASNPKLASLYALVVLQMLEQSKVKEETLRWLVPQLLTALKSSNFPELQSSAYMVVTKLASKSILTEKVVDALVKSLVKHAQTGAQMNALLCVIFLAQTQPSFRVSSSTGKYLVHMENAADFLRDATATYESTKFVQLLTVFLTQHMKSTDDDYFRLLTAIIDTVPTVADFTNGLVQTLVAQAHEQGFAMDNERVQAISQTLVALSKKNATKVDVVVNSVLSNDGKKSKEKKRLTKFLAITFENVANSAHFVPSHTDAATSLALALDHPTEHIRYQALVSLAKMHDANSEATTTGKDQVLTSGDVLVRRLLDDSERITKFMLSSSLADLMLSLCSKKKMLEAIVQVVYKWFGRGKPNVVEAVADFALKNFRETAGSLDVDEKLLTLFISLVVSGNSSKKSNSVTVDMFWTWVATLDHAFGVSASKAMTINDKTVEELAKTFGRTLSDDIPALLPYCLSWSQQSDLNEKPLTDFLIQVLSAARSQLASKKTKKAKEQLTSLDQSFRFILKKEFVSLCEQNATDAQAAQAVNVASKISEVAYDVFAVSRDDFDSCVATLLQSPTPVFIRIQECLLELFHADLETELLPTMARLVTASSSASDVMKVLSKTRALDIICAVLEGFSYTETDEELRQLVHIVPVVIVALSDANKSVRQSALTCLDRWVTSCGDAVRSSNSKDLKVLQKASMFFLKAKQDMLMDAHSISALCGMYSTEDSSSSFHQLLMDFISSANSDEICIAVKLLELLEPVKDTAFWLQSVDFFHQALTGCSTGASPNTTKLMTGFLAHYLDVDVAVTTTKAGQVTIAQEFQDAVLGVLRTDKDVIAHLQKLQLFVLSNLTTTFYEALGEVSRHVFVEKLLHLLMIVEEAVASKLIQCLNTLPLSNGIFVRLLEEKLSTAKSFKATEFQKLSCILEVLAIKVDDASSAEGSKTDANKLLTTLGDVLALFCDPKHESIVSEYILQVLFSCLRRVCAINCTNERVNKASKHLVSDVKPELLVKHTLSCLGRTSSPQTRNDALLFISSLVNLHPASVLTSLDKILSFVSAGSIRQNDEYSFHVLETIIKSVVPHIVATKSQPSDALITPQQFISLFVNAFNQIPKSKREPLFQVLVGSLGSELLPYCAVALLQHAAIVEDMDVQRERIQFAHNLCFTFDCAIQVSSLVMVLRMARDLLPHVVEESDTDTDEMDDDEDIEYDRFVLDERLVSSIALSRQFNSILIKFVTAHLRARELHHKILNYESEQRAMEDEDDEGTDELQQNYLMLAQLVLLYFRRVAREQSVHDDESGFWTVLANESIEILGALQQLLSTPGFVAVISELLHHDNSLVRKKAMQLFNERLQEERDSLTSGEALLFIDMLDELDTILKNVDGSENSVNIQTALLSVDILARNFAVEHTKRFQQVLPTIVKYVDQDVASAAPMTLHLFGCAFVCLSSICRAVGPVVFPLLPKFFPRLLNGIEYCSSSNGVSGTKAVLQCLLASLEVFTDKIPQFLGPYLPAIIRALLTPSVLTTAPTNAQVLLSVECCLLNLCNHVELRQLLPTLFGAYEHVLTLKNDNSVSRLFSVVGMVVNDLDSAAIRKHLPAFARFFVTALDVRRVHASKLQNLDEVEDEVLECLVSFILKLSEKQLKPLFLKVTEWAQTRVGSAGKSGDISRRIAFFKLVVKLSERLRGIFVPYYAHVLEFLVSGLRDSRAVLMQKPPRGSEESDSDDDDDFFANEAEPPTKKTKLSGSAVDAKTERERNSLLLSTAVRALDGCFVHDNDGFIEKDRFDVVLTPLVDVLDVLQHDSSMREFVLETVAPCLANLAWAAKSDLLWKPLHYAVLMKSRGDYALVRLAALVTVEKCYQVIGDEFLAMLPESIPFLAELMEDTNDEVEKTCHRVIKQIEDISGESLDQYLTS